MTFSDVIGAASLYFALISILGSIFFFSISQWLNDILGNKASWKKLKDYDPEGNDYLSRLNCYHQAKKSYSFVTILVWFVLSAFMLFIEFKIFSLFNEADSLTQVKLNSYVLNPSVYFLIIYFILSIIFLIIGYCKSKKIIDEF